jgi:hypothetical protein
MTGCTNKTGVSSSGATPLSPNNDLTRSQRILRKAFLHPFHRLTNAPTFLILRLPKNIIPNLENLPIPILKHILILEELLLSC